MLGALGAFGSGLMSGLGSLGGMLSSAGGSLMGGLKGVLGSAGGGGMGELLKGGGNLLSAGSSLYGAIDQRKKAKKELEFQRKMYNDWNNTRLGNQANMENAYNFVFGEPKRQGMLDSGIY